MKYIIRLLFLAVIVVLSVSFQNSYGGVMLPPVEGIPTGPVCDTFDDCPFGFGDCGPDPNGGPDMVCIPMFCSFDSDCVVTNQCDVGVCALPNELPGPADAVEAFVVTANHPETGDCQVGSVDPYTGRFDMWFAAGCTQCGGIDMDGVGNLVVSCEDDTNPADAASANRQLQTGVIVELDALTGVQLSNNIHGRSNQITDIAVLPDRSVLSHETLDEDTIHRHDQAADFIATPKGPTGLDVDKAGLAATDGRRYFTLATNESGEPTLYDIDQDTGEAMVARTIIFPNDIVIASFDKSMRAVAIKDINIEALVAMRPISIINPGPITASADENNKAAVSLANDAADYAVLLTKDDPDPQNCPECWAAIGFLDRETGQIDHIIEIQSDEELLFTGLTLKRPIQRNVPTLSEWGIIATAAVLGLIGIAAMRRRKINYVEEN